MADNGKNLPDKTEGLPLEHPKVQGKVVRARRMIKSAKLYSSEVFAKIGKELIGVKQTVDHGGWTKLMTQDEDFSLETARNYMRLSRFAEQYRNEYGKLRHLGYTKVIAIAKCPEIVIKQMVRKKNFSIPGTDRTETLNSMSVFDLYAILGQLCGQPAFDLNRNVKGIRTSVRSIVKRVKTMVPHWRKLRRGDVKDIEEDLEGILKAIRRLPE